MILWKSTQDTNLSQIPEQFSDVIKVKDNKLVLSVCDMSSFSLQVFLYAALKLKPTQDHPEMLGCDWLNQNPDSPEKCKFLRDSILYMAECINESPNLREESGQHFIFFDAEEAILLIHEVEMALHKYMKEGDIKLFSRLAKNMLIAKPYMDRLNAILWFLNHCINIRSSYTVEQDDQFDMALAKEVFPNVEE